MKVISFSRRRAFQKTAERLGKEGEAVQFGRCDSVLCLFVSAEQYERCHHLLPATAQVEENICVRVHSHQVIPWGIKKIGAPKLWKETMGKGVKVAVIDTGIVRTHPDLRGRVRGSADFVGGNIVDRRGNGGHGTHIAGTIAALDNQIGVVGVAPQVSLYDVRAFDSDGVGELAAIVKGIDWAITNKMDIINMSFGMVGDSPALHAAIKRASAAGIFLVASAGNNGGEIEFPARYPEVIAVGASTKQGELAAFSARGHGLDVIAPGVSILSTWPRKTYKKLSGTSMAAAHISGLVALQLAESRKKGRKGKRLLNKQACLRLIR
ncbi:subtilase family protein [Aneurinibacillus soli]|uniref:Subtilisin E n=1 Tax=Aneurinibacillus soli TaxID=1500254 RepID=A0A0U5C9B2_9BACL|nr:S8 family peptidase [Aneurinibacillus soli]PYE59499.1 subtilase family protein [Aneurinibacillus soli]BAU29171.1 Subtilisin E precursor [Aneurinibacillus soli]